MNKDIIANQFSDSLLEGVRLIGAHQQLFADLDHLQKSLLDSFNLYVGSTQLWYELNNKYYAIEVGVDDFIRKFHHKCVSNRAVFIENKGEIRKIVSRIKIDLPVAENGNKSVVELIRNLEESGYISAEELNYLTPVRLLNTAMTLSLYSGFKNLLEYYDHESFEIIHDEHYRLSVLLRSLKRCQGLSKAIKSDEPSRTAILANFMDNFLDARDESRWGKSFSDINLGELDIKILNQNKEVIAVIEGLNLSSIVKKTIKDHYQKIFGYDANGNKLNYIVYFYEGEDLSYAVTEISKFYNSEYSVLLREYDESTIPYYTKVENIKVFKSRSENISIETIHIIMSMDS